MRLVATTLTALLLATSTAAGAEEIIEYEKNTVLDFDEDTIEGDLTRPDGELVDAKRRVTHSNLVRVRESFRDQVLESVGEL
ncbi:MAG TPA: adventurous gliding motility protein CglF [Vulgatibacter sp.]|nr:adventurous gliding motility protein CglF [Vulgatibacter sp.]